MQEFFFQNNYGVSLNQYFFLINAIRVTIQLAGIQYPKLQDALTLNSIIYLSTNSQCIVKLVSEYGYSEIDTNYFSMLHANGV